MSPQEATVLIAHQHDLIQQYERFINGQRRLINSLWEHVYMLHKISLTIDKPDLEKAQILASMSYAACQAGRPGEAIESANEGEESASDRLLESVKHLMRDFEDSDNGASID